VTTAAGVDHLTGATLDAAPVPCRACMWWQTRPGREPDERSRWVADAEDDFGPWGKLYRDESGVTGLIQYGPAQEFPRAQTLPAGPPSRDAVLVTCAYLTDAHSPWVLQSLFLAAIGECRDRGLPALEAFAYRYPSGEDFATRFLGHRTIFPADFLADFGFAVSRSAGMIELMRLDLRAIELEPERRRMARLRERLAPLVSPAPAPVR
jgi:hypothetical protein